MSGLDLNPLAHVAALVAANVSPNVLVLRLRGDWDGLAHAVLLLVQKGRVADALDLVLLGAPAIACMQVLERYYPEQVAGFMQAEVMFDVSGYLSNPAAWERKRARRRQQLLDEGLSCPLADALLDTMGLGLRVKVLAENHPLGTVLRNMRG